MKQFLVLLTLTGLVSTACAGRPTLNVESTVQAAIATTQTAQPTEIPTSKPPTTTPLPEPTDTPMPTPLPLAATPTSVPPTPSMGQVQGNLPEAAGIKVVLCPEQSLKMFPSTSGSPKTPPECEGRFWSETVDATGHFLFPALPAGGYYAVFDIPEELEGNGRLSLCNAGEWHGLADIPGGVREICFDKNTLGPTVVVLAGQTTNVWSAREIISEATLQVTSTATQAAQPAATATPTGTPVPRPGATPSPSAVVTAATLNVREGPGTEYASVAQLEQGDGVFVVGQFDNCAWVQVAISGQVPPEGWVSGDSGSLTLQQPCDSIPIGSFRPFTGLVKPNALGGGYGELTVDNGTPADGVVILTLDEQPIIAAYVRAGESFTMKDISDGTYYIYFSTGSEWNGEKFTHTPSYHRFEDTIEFATTAQTYSTWSITLHGVVGGNAAAEEVGADEFPGLGK